MAELLIDEWLTKWNKGWTDRKAQHLRPVRDVEDDLIEIIKYGSKTFTEPDVNRNARMKGEAKFTLLGFTIYSML